MFTLLRTYKPILKAARGTPLYAGVRELAQNWLWTRHITQLLHSQNAKLYLAAKERDRLIAQLRRYEERFGVIDEM